MNSKNKNQTKENWIEKIKCKRENHEDQLCGGCKDCQAFWGLKSLIESILKSEREKWLKEEIMAIEKKIAQDMPTSEWLEIIQKAIEKAKKRKRKNKKEL